MDRYRQKLDEQAFVGILIGYDTSARPWVFLNSKTGRNVRTVFARFYEWKRDPEEHIDMSSMLLQPPSFERETKIHCWKCQLWPKTLWPDLEADCLGHVNSDFPSGKELCGRHDENITFDRDLLVGNKQLPSNAESKSTPDD